MDGLLGCLFCDARKLYLANHRLWTSVYSSERIQRSNSDFRSSSLRGIPVSNYRRKIDRAISERTGEIILNGSHAHAAIIIERMFASAKKKMRILSLDFDPRIFGVEETVEQAQLFLGLSDRNAQILIEDKTKIIPRSHPFLNTLLKNSNLQFKLLRGDLREIVDLNFALMDDCGLRYEGDESGSSSAFARFQESDPLVTRLSKLFDNLWNFSQEITFQELEAA